MFHDQTGNKTVLLPPPFPPHPHPFRSSPSCHASLFRVGRSLDKLLARASNTRGTFKIVKSSGQHRVSKLLRVSNERSGRIWSEVQVFEELMMDSPPPPPRPNIAKQINGKCRSSKVSLLSIWHAVFPKQVREPAERPPVRRLKIRLPGRWKT